MKHMTRAVAALGLSAVAAAGLVQAQEVALSPEEIRAAWEGKAASFRLANGGTADLLLKSDGSAEVRGAATDTGTWRLWEKGYCATWKQIRRGQERCFTVVRRGAEVVVLNPDTSPNATLIEVR